MATATLKKVNDVVQLHALINGKKVVVTEDVIRSNLRLDDADGVKCLPTEEIFVELARMGYEKPPPKLTFYKAFFSSQCKFLIHTLVQCVSAKRTTWNEFSYSMASVVICLATVDELEQGKHNQALDIIKLKNKVKKLEKKKKSKSSGGCIQTMGGGIEAIDADEDITLLDMKTQVDVDAKLQGRIDDDNAVTKDVNATEPTVFYDEEESFKKLKAVEVSGFESTQETPTNDLKEISEEDVQNILEIILVSEFKVEALQVKYPIIDWEIHIEGSRTYWKIIRVSGITEAYHSFEDMLKEFDKEDLVALWSLVKEKFSTTVLSVDKEKALWLELKRLFKPDVDDVLWKLQRINVAGSRLMLLGKDDTTAEVMKKSL
nr:hypothetical protein [Tanacetum cinerariifolium]